MPMLFDSAFNPSGSSASSSKSTSALVAGGGPSAAKKRKRHSSSGAQDGQAAASSAYAKRESVKQAQSSLEKAMKELGKSKGPAAGIKKKASRESLASPGSAKRSKHEAQSKSAGQGNQKDGKRPIPQPQPTPKPDLTVPPELNVASAAKPSTSESPLPSKSSSSNASLTPLQSKLSSKLSSAKFRWLNEQLYSLPSADGAQLMASSIAAESAGGAGATAFDAYHDAHRQQTAAWPVPPLPLLAQKLREDESLGEGAVVLDLGCGDAELARSLLSGGSGSGSGGKKGKKNKGKQSTTGEASSGAAIEKHFRVISYDLVGDVEALPESQADSKLRGYVAPVDFLTSIPLPGDPGGRPVANGVGSSGDGPAIVDAAVCCLSLMGVNWLGGIYEATRVLRKG